MVELLDNTTPLETWLRQKAEGLSGARRACADAFLQIGWPTSRDEEFRFTPFREVRETNWLPAGEPNVGDKRIENCPFAAMANICLVLVDGVFHPELSRLPTDEQIAVSWHEELVGGTQISGYGGKLGSTNDARFLDLNGALFPGQLVVQVSQGAACEGSLQVLHVTSSGESTHVHPRIRIELEEGSSLHFVEAYNSFSKGCLTNSVTEILLGKRSRLEHVRYQTESRQSVHLGQVWVHQEAESQYASTSIQFGAKLGRVESNVWINGEHTETTLDGTYVGANGQVLDNRTRIDHAKPNCHSFEVFKGILGDEGHGVFNGKIFVYQDAQKTDAKQTNQALLLSASATINAKPQLEIFADDVKCTHGATVGQLRPEQLFYLQSRGIPEAEAKAMLVYAFAAEVLEKISLEPLREMLEAELFSRLQAKE